MAGMDLIDQARKRLEDASLNLDQLVQSWFDLVGENVPCPAWLFMLKQQQDQVDVLIQEYFEAVHKHARPLLRDMERLRV